MALLDQPDHERELITVEHFTNLSAEINYNLSAKRPDEDEALLALLLGPARFSDIQPLLLAMKTIRLGYGDTRRKIGPLAVLHPLRTAALVSRTMINPGLFDMLLAMLHDKGEDLPLEVIADDKRAAFKESYQILLDHLGGAKGERLDHMIRVLTQEYELGYFGYLLQLIDRSKETPELLHVKLADRLDNTLDNHIGRPGVLHYNFFRSVFDLLFVPVYKGVNIRRYHFLPSPEEGSLLLSQLFKNAVFLSLLRHESIDKLDATTERLFDAVAIASIREAQWIALELFTEYQSREGVDKLRSLVMDTMKYSIAGGATDIRTGKDEQSVDGLILNNFVVTEQKIRRSRMSKLFANHEFLTTTIVTLIATFASFLNDPEFAIRGIDRDGIKPV
ncbi:MAG: hypothetical protein V2A56_03625 [bacterium]